MGIYQKVRAKYDPNVIEKRIFSKFPSLLSWNNVDVLDLEREGDDDKMERYMAFIKDYVKNNPEPKSKQIQLG